MKRIISILTICIMVLSTCFCVSAETEKLTDEQKKALAYAQKEEIIKGYEDGSIKPYNTLTRAEFVTMIVRYAGFETKEDSTFKDADKTHWASKYIAAGVKNGLLDGVGDNKFDPDSSVKVEHAAKILTALKGFTDEVDIEKSGAWPEPYMMLAEYAELFNDADHYKEGEELTRIDVAVYIYNLSNIEKQWFDYDKKGKLCIYFTRTDGTSFGYYCGLTLKEKGEISDEPYIEESNKDVKIILEMVNAERAKKGHPLLEIDDALQKAANIRAEELSDTFSHERPDGTSPFTALQDAGIEYSVAGENIAKGQPDGKSAMEAWLNSPPHRENILKKEYEKIGIGIFEDANGTWYWVQMFIA